MACSLQYEIPKLVLNRKTALCILDMLQAIPDRPNFPPLFHLKVGGASVGKPTDVIGRQHRFKGLVCWFRLQAPLMDCGIPESAVNAPRRLHWRGAGLRRPRIRWGCCLIPLSR